MKLQRLYQTALAALALTWMYTAQAVFIVDSANGVVTDTTTGLMWDQCPLGLSGSTCTTGAANIDDWTTATTTDVTTANTTIYKNHSDWFLPSISQLQSLNTVSGSPTIDTTFFPMADTTTAFWSATSLSLGFAQFITYLNGNVGTIPTSSTMRVRLARNGVAMTISQSGPTPALQAGVNSTYTLTITNNGLAAANSIQVSDVIPSGFGFVSATGTNWLCSNTAGTVGCTFSGSLAASGGVSTISLVVTPPSSAVNTSVINYASVGTTGDAAPAAGASCTPSVSCSSSTANLVGAAPQVQSVPFLSQTMLNVLVLLMSIFALRSFQEFKRQR